MSTFMAINTYNESSLHKTLKTYFCQTYFGETEVQDSHFIYDIVTKENDVIEIQTKNLSKLITKIESTIHEQNRKLKLVFPLVINKQILLLDENGQKISKRKSPITNSIYDLFEELTGIYPLLLEKNFSLTVISINVTEIRTRTTDNVQSQNNRRRFKKNWLKIDKKLDEILSISTFSCKNDYLKLIPFTTNDEFCAYDLRNFLKEKKGLSRNVLKKAYLMIWVLSRMNLIQQTQIIDKKHYYRICS